jgi:hypothetical protein
MSESGDCEESKLETPKISKEDFQELTDDEKDE